MITVEEINSEITRLEAQPQSYQTISTLADLYTVRDHIRLPLSDGTDFQKACAGKRVNDILAIFDELMETLMMMQPRMYDLVMKRLTTI